MPYQHEEQTYNGVSTEKFCNFKQYKHKGFFSWSFWESFLSGCLYFITYFGVCINLLGKFYHSSAFLSFLAQFSNISGLGTFITIILPILAFCTILYLAVKYGMKQYDLLRAAYHNENWLTAAHIKYTDALETYSFFGCPAPSMEPKINKSAESHPATILDHFITISVGVIVNSLSAVGYLGYLNNIVNVSVWSTFGIIGPISPLVISILFILLYTCIAVWIKEIHNPEHAKNVTSLKDERADFLASMLNPYLYHSEERYFIDIGWVKDASWEPGNYENLSANCKRCKDRKCEHCTSYATILEQYSEEYRQAEQHGTKVSLYYILQLHKFEFLYTYDEEIDYFLPLVQLWGKAKTLNQKDSLHRVFVNSKNNDMVVNRENNREVLWFPTRDAVLPGPPSPTIAITESSTPQADATVHTHSYSAGLLFVGAAHAPRCDNDRSMVRPR